MKIMSIIRRIARKPIAVPPIDKERLVELHPELIRFFSPDEQLNIALSLWYSGRISEDQVIALCPGAEAEIDDFREDVLASCWEPDCETRWDEAF